MTHEQIGRAYEYLALTGSQPVMIGYVLSRSIRLAKSKGYAGEAARAEEINSRWANGKDALRALPYAVIGEVVTSAEYVGHRTNREGLVEAYTECIEAIKVGNFAVRDEEVKIKTHDERKQDLIEELISEASAALDKAAMTGCEISIEAVEHDERDDFVRANSAAQLCIMGNGDSQANAGETFGIVIRNAQGMIIKGVLARVATVKHVE